MTAREVWLSEEQRYELLRFAKNGNHNAHLITRAKTILALDRTGKKDHLRIGRICESVNLSRQAVNDVRADFFAAESIRAYP